MNGEVQFKIIKGKGSYGSNKQVRTVGEALTINKESVTCHQLRIMHCPLLTSIGGIENCKKLITLNLSSNALSSIDSISCLTQLQVLVVKSNVLRSIKGVGRLKKLTKLDASRNFIESLQGLGQGNSHLISLLMEQNSLKDLNQLIVLLHLVKLQELCFKRNKNSNPFCSNPQVYYSHLAASIGSLSNIKKIDDISKQEFDQITANKSQEYMEESNHHRRFDEPSWQSQGRNQPHPYAQTQQVNPAASQQMLLMTQQCGELERLLDIKEEALEELRAKKAQLQINNAQFYKDSLRKEVEYERAAGQITELARGIDQKDANISELHRRVEQLLKSVSDANSLNESRWAELQKVKEECSALKLQNSQLSAVKRQQESRLRQLQKRALSNIEDKSQKIEEMRHRQDDLMKENYLMQREQDEFKERIRELTQLLKQWEFKYEQKIKELEANHHEQRDQLCKEYEHRIEHIASVHEQERSKMYHDFQDKVKGLEHEYTGAIEASLDKYGKLRKAYDEKNSSQSELRAMVKTLMTKNAQQEHTLSECQAVILTSRKKVVEVINENESLHKQNNELGAKSHAAITQLQSELQKNGFEYKRMEKELRDMRMSNEYLQSHFDKVSNREQEVEELQQRLEGLQDDLKAKNLMLDDKNDTIESLKNELEGAKERAGEMVRAQELQKVNTKYRKNKDKCRELQKQIEELIDRNKELSEKEEYLAKVEEEFDDIKAILDKQEADVKDKNDTIQELLRVMQVFKQRLTVLEDEAQSLRREKARLTRLAEDRQTKLSSQVRQKESMSIRLREVEQEMGKYKAVAQQFSSIAKGLNFA